LSTHVNSFISHASWHQCLPSDGRLIVPKKMSYS